MDNKFLKDDLIERYVLNQLNDQELANLRGQLMFDEELRKQVVETKMLMNGLATIAGESIISNPSSASKVVQMPASNNRIMLRAAMVIGVLMLAGLTYYFYDSSIASTTASSSPQEKIKENVDIPTQVGETDADENIAREKEPETTKDAKEKEEETKPTKPRIFAGNLKKENSTKPTVEVEENPEEEMTFGSAPSLANNRNDFFPSDENLGYAASDEEVNEFIEDAITNSTTKSRIGIVKIKNFQNSDVLKRNQHNAVALNFEGTIDTKASNNKKYVFKLFNNNKDAFISNTPLYKEPLKPLLLGTEQYDFKIEENIELKPGLYYFTIEEEVNNDQDMIYAGRFYVSAGKFHVK